MIGSLSLGIVLEIVGIMIQVICFLYLNLLFSGVWCYYNAAKRRAGKSIRGSK